MLKVPATFDAYSSRADGSLGLRFSTQEINASHLADIHAHARLFGWLLFSENDVQSGDVPKEEAYEHKTPSKRLRDVLFVLHHQHALAGDFEVFYREKMEKFIEMVKSELDAY